MGAPSIAWLAAWTTLRGAFSSFATTILKWHPDARSAPGPMALRILSYTSLLYQELVRNEAPEVSQWLPAVVPVVLYNGTAPWRAPQEVGELIAPAGQWFGAVSTVAAVLRG